MTKLYGFYSSEAAKKYGVKHYNTPEGKEVVVTFVDEDRNQTSYKWPDAVFVDEIVLETYHKYPKNNPFLNCSHL